MERKLIYPAIYKHFKNKYYATISIVKPSNSCSIKLNTLSMIAEHTETNDIYNIIKINNKYYYMCKKPIKQDNRDMVLYKSLYNNHIAYLRPLDMFMSKVDKEKYPDIKQEYRFELIRY